MATSKPKMNGTASKQVRKTVRRTVRKQGSGAIVAMVIVFALALAAGVLVSRLLTKNDDFYLLTRKEQVLTAGTTYQMSELTAEYYAVSFGKDMSDRVAVTPSFEVAEDGSVTLAEGKYNITYTMPAFFGMTQIVRVAYITVVPAGDGTALTATGGASHG